MNQRIYGSNQYMSPMPTFSGIGYPPHQGPTPPHFMPHPHGHSIPTSYIPPNRDYIDSIPPVPHHAIPIQTNVSYQGYHNPHINSHPPFTLNQSHQITPHSLHYIGPHPPPRYIPDLDMPNYGIPYSNSQHMISIPFRSQEYELESEKPKRLIDFIYSEKERNNSPQKRQIEYLKNEKELTDKKNYPNYIQPPFEFYQDENEQDTKHAKKIPLKILNEISKSICKIIVMDSEKNKNWNATGFFLQLQKERVLNLLITNNHVIPQEMIDSKDIIAIILENGNEQIIELNNKERFIKSFNPPIDITAIEILDKDEINNNIKYLSYDLNYEEGYNQYINADIFSLQHPLGNDIECASGKIIKISSNNNFEFIHTIDTDKGSSGSPIILVGNSRVVGIHKANIKNNKNNKGTFIGVLLNEIKNLKFNKENLIENENPIRNNNIKITPKRKENKENFKTPSNNTSNIFIIEYKTNIENNIRIFGDNFVKNNINNCRIIINGINLELCRYINKELVEGDKLQIQLKEIKTISDMSYMFEGCKSLLFVTDQSIWDTSNVINMSYMFCGCKSLVYLPSSFSKWNTYNVVDMTSMFYLCNSLTSLPNISEWKISKVKSMIGMFYGCSSLSSIPDISNWDTSNVINMLNLFYNCSSLKILPDISKWDTSNVTNMSGMFYNCSSLKDLPNISKWNVSNVTDMRLMFGNCSLLTSMPDISKWNLSNFIEMKGIFEGCNEILKNSESLRKLKQKYKVKH